MKVDVDDTGVDEGYSPDSPRPRTSRRGAGGLLIGLAAAVLLVRRCDRDSDPTPGPGPSPEPLPVNGPAILFVLTGDPDDLSADQAAATGSAVVMDHCRSRGVMFRRYYRDADLSAEAEPVRAMMRAALQGTPPCMVTVDSAGGGRVEDIPDGPDAVVALIDSLR